MSSYTNQSTELPLFLIRAKPIAVGGSLDLNFPALQLFILFSAVFHAAVVPAIKDKEVGKLEYPKLDQLESGDNDDSAAAAETHQSVSFSWSYEAQKIVHEFDPKIPIEQAITPPSSWYTDPSFYAFELHRVFYRGWQAVGYTEQIKEPHDFFSGRLGNVEFVVCRDDDGKIAAFHNVCKHHASLLVSGSGKKSCFTCPYHGWTYGLNGALRKATRISGIQNFNVNEFGLEPIKVATWGPFVLLNMDKEILPKDNLDTDSLASEWLGSSSEILSLNGIDSPLTYVCRREYIIECNWKVFCDNYLDGGYHVPFAHKDLASGLSLDSYMTLIFEKVSIQSVEGGSEEREDDRLGSKALYAFIYPNFMINRYGPWMDTNLVIPLGPRKCLVVFDYFLEASLKV